MPFNALQNLTGADIRHIAAQIRTNTSMGSTISASTLTNSEHPDGTQGTRAPGRRLPVLHGDSSLCSINDKPFLPLMSIALWYCTVAIIFPKITLSIVVTMSCTGRGSPVFGGIDKLPGEGYSQVSTLEFL